MKSKGMLALMALLMGTAMSSGVDMALISPIAPRYRRYSSAKKKIPNPDIQNAAEEKRQRKAEKRMSQLKVSV